MRLYSRPGNDLTHRFPLIVETLARMRPAVSCSFHRSNEKGAPRGARCVCARSAYDRRAPDGSVNGRRGRLLNRTGISGQQCYVALLFGTLIAFLALLLWGCP